MPDAPSTILDSNGNPVSPDVSAIDSPLGTANTASAGNPAEGSDANVAAAVSTDEPAPIDHDAAAPIDALAPATGGVDPAQASAVTDTDSHAPAIAGDTEEAKSPEAGASDAATPVLPEVSEGAQMGSDAANPPEMSGAAPVAPVPGTTLDADDSSHEVEGSVGTENTTLAVPPSEAEADTASSGTAAPAASTDAASTDEAAASDTPAETYGDPHPEAEPIIEAATADVMDGFKAAGNTLKPAMDKLPDFEAEIEALEDEAKARFAFARQKASEYLAAIEALFKRS